jgi:tetratricopeptide (TPR) repeat protein
MNLAGSTGRSRKKLVARTIYWCVVAVLSVGFAQFESALEYLVDATFAQPDEPEAWIRRVRVELLLGRMDEGRRSLRTVEALILPDRQLPELALLYMKAGECANAARLLDRLIGLDPEDLGLLADRNACRGMEPDGR